MILTVPRLMLGSVAMAALLMMFALRSSPPPPAPPQPPPVVVDTRIIPLTTIPKADREPLKAPERVDPVPPVEAQAAPAPAPARAPVQAAPDAKPEPEPEPAARHHADGGNLCTRHGMRLVWINSKHWRCRK